MIKWTGRPSYKQYLPAKPIKRGIKVWLRCDADNAFFNDFNVYLGRATHQLEHGLGYDIVYYLIRDLQRYVYREHKPSMLFLHFNIHVQRYVYSVYIVTTMLFLVDRESRVEIPR